MGGVDSAHPYSDVFKPLFLGWGLLFGSERKPDSSLGRETRHQVLHDIASESSGTQKQGRELTQAGKL